MSETLKAYRGSRNGHGDKKVEVVEVTSGVRGEPSHGNGIALVPHEVDVSGSVRELEHPSGAVYDWPGSPGEGGPKRLAEALLRDAGEAGVPGGDRYGGLAEEYAAEWVGELPSWSGPFIDEGALLLGSDGWDLLGSLWGTGRRRNMRDAGHSPGGTASSGAPETTPPAEADPEEVRKVLTERYFEDWHLPASRVRGWAEDRAAVHAEAREVVEGGKGLFLVDLYGPLARRIREVADAAGRSSDVVPLGAWADRAALNVLERPPWLAVEDLAAAIAGAVASVHGWPDPSSTYDDMDEEDREEALAHALLGDALLTLCVANAELSRGSGTAARYTFFDARRLVEPSPPNARFFSDLLPLLGDGRGFSGENLAVSWERWRRLPREERGVRARPVLGFLAELEQEGWARAFASPRPARRAVRPGDALLGGAGSNKIVLVDLSGPTKPGRAAEIVGAVLLRLFAQRFGAGASGPAKAFVNGRHAHASPPLRFRSELWAVAFEAQWSGMDVRPC